MSRTLLLLPVLVMAMVPAARAAEPQASPATTSTEVRHSGTVARVDPARGMLTFQELVSWTGPGTGVVERTVKVADTTDVRLVVRDETSASPTEIPGFRKEPLKLSELQPGDFVTVTTPRDRPVATTVEVVRPQASAESTR